MSWRWLVPLACAWLLSALAGRPGATAQVSGLESPQRYAPAYLVVNVPAARLDLWLDGGLVRSYRVAVGSPAFPTPLGEFQLNELTWNPWWVPPASAWARNEKTQPPGARNPMGRVKLRFDTLYYLHGTADTWSIGRPVSHGCIRLPNAEALEVARLVVGVAGPVIPAALLDSLERETGRTYRILMNCTVPMIVRYDLAEVRDTVLELYRDVYGRGLEVRAEALAALARAGFSPTDLNVVRLEQTLSDGRTPPRTIPLRSILQPDAWRRLKIVVTRPQIERARKEETMTAHIPERDWAAALWEFTRRNAGRLTALEEDDPEIGAQQEEKGIQLRGVAFDPHDRSVAIMLGELAGTEEHLTHVIRDVDAVEVLKSATGRDVALRIARGDGQTLLRFCST